MKNMSLVPLLVLLAVSLAVPVRAGDRDPGSGISGSEGRQTGGAVVARVNGVEIMADTVAAMMTRMGAKMKSGTELEEIRKAALDRLILQELAYQKAKASGLNAGAEEIGKAKESIKEKMGGEEGFRRFLEKEKITETVLISQLERSIVLKLIFTREVRNKSSIPEDELRNEYEREKGQYVVPEKIMVTEVVFLLATEDRESLKKAEEVLGRINADKEKNPWNLVLDGTFVVRDLEVLEDRETELYEEAKKLKLNELSGIIKTDDGLHILLLKEYSPEKRSSFEEVRGLLEEKLRVKAQNKRLREWESELKKEAKIEIIGAGESK